MIHPCPAKGPKVLELLQLSFVPALPGDKLGVRTSKQLDRLQETRHARLADDLCLSPPALVHDDPTTNSERTETIDGFGSVDSSHEGCQRAGPGCEHTRATERLRVAEVADLVDDRELWVIPEVAESEAERLAGSVAPLIRARFGCGARPHDR